MRRRHGKMSQIHHWFCIVLALCCGTFEVDAAPSVQHLEGECRPYQGTVCLQELGAGYMSNVFIPTSITLDNGTLLEGLTEQDFAHRVKVRLDNVDKSRPLMSDSCYTASRVGFCLNSFKSCNIDAGHHFPDIPCYETCRLFHEACASEFQILVNLNMLDGVPLCGILDNRWTKFGPERFADGDPIQFVPDYYFGNPVFVQDTYSISNGQGWTAAGSCIPSTKLADALQGNNNNTPDGCAPLGEDLCRSDLGLTPNPCQGCDFLCPLPVFQDNSVFAKAEYIPAIMSIPFLVIVVVLEVVGWKSERKNANLLLSCVTGLLYVVQVVNYVRDDRTGCNERGTFPSDSVEFWSSSEQQMICTTMTLSPHLLQMMVLGMSCFLLETYRRFSSATRFETYHQRFPISQIVFVIGLPLVLAVFTWKDGRYRPDAMVVEGGNPSVQMPFIVIRQLYKCAPVFESDVEEFLVIYLPLFVGLMACAVISFKVHWICNIVLRSLQENNSYAQHQKTNSRKTRRLSMQMLIMSLACEVLLVVQLISLVQLKLKSEDISMRLQKSVVCALAPEAYEDCAYFQMTISDSDQNLFLLSVMSWSNIPLFLSSVIFISFFMKRVATMTTYKKYVTPSSAVPTQTNAHSKEKT